jgi:hypothetical protein
MRLIDERAEALGYAPGEFLAAARDGRVSDTVEASRLLVLVELLD